MSSENKVSSTPENKLFITYNVVGLDSATNEDRESLRESMMLAIHKLKLGAEYPEYEEEKITISVYHNLMGDKLVNLPDRLAIKTNKIQEDDKNSLRIKIVSATPDISIESIPRILNLPGYSVNNARYEDEDVIVVIFVKNR